MNPWLLRVLYVVQGGVLDGTSCEMAALSWLLSDKKGTAGTKKAKLNLTERCPFFRHPFPIYKEQRIASTKFSMTGNKTR